MRWLFVVDTIVASCKPVISVTVKIKRWFSSQEAFHAVKNRAITIHLTILYCSPPCSPTYLGLVQDTILNDILSLSRPVPSARMSFQSYLQETYRRPHGSKIAPVRSGNRERCARRTRYCGKCCMPKCIAHPAGLRPSLGCVGQQRRG